MKGDALTRRRVLVLDMQPIEPAVGGGRVRLLGLYHSLGADLPTLYVGTYDWPGEERRAHRLSHSLTELDIPLSEAHFRAVGELQAKMGGKTIIDTTFPRFAHLSKSYLQRVREEVLRAEIVFFSHPWIHPLVRDLLVPARQLVVYDSQNVEGFLRAHLLDDGDGPGAEIVREVVRVESALCEEAHLVLACSHDDRLLFNKFYGTPLKKIRVVPNGTFTDRTLGRRYARVEKGELGLPNCALAVFIGSSYPPNVEAANYIIDRLAPELPEVTFAICGGVGESLDALRIQRSGPSNVVVTGTISESEKHSYFQAADLAVNPMFSGSGTNIKMLEFFAVPLPVVTTPIGARGIIRGPIPAMRVVSGCEFQCTIKELLANAEDRARLRTAAQKLVEKHYSWERISRDLGRLVTRHHSRLDTDWPRFTVVIPTYERQNRLGPLLESLEQQSYKSFEVVIVDQSEEPWPDRDKSWELDLLYYHTDIADVVHARNKGAEMARGDILAFLDDDCVPEMDWLENADRAFEGADIIGVEGLIKSCSVDDTDYRAVTNLGVPGLGFMTANLFLKLDVFNAIDGFDYSFSPTPFREDTDLGWRAQDHGEIAFVPQVAVYHPPHPRASERESWAARSKFFAKDPLLEKKHPVRYRQLFLVEDHWRQTPGFWEYFFHGARKYGVKVPDYYLWRFGQIARRDLEERLEAKDSV